MRIGKVELKNIQRPVEVYRIVLGPKTREAAAGKRRTRLRRANPAANNRDPSPCSRS